MRGNTPELRKTKQTLRRKCRHKVRAEWSEIQAVEEIELHNPGLVLNSIWVIDEDEVNDTGAVSTGVLSKIVRPRELLAAHIERPVLAMRI